MSWLRAVTRSSIGRKMVVAVTGLAMLLFLVAHMLGNLKAFGGADALNDYAALLRIEPELLYVLRAGLIVCLCLHVFFVVQLSRENRAARPVRYAAMRTVTASLASRTMLLGGVVVLAYVTYHLLHLTFRTVHRDLVPFDHTNVFGNVSRSFRQPGIVAVYVLAQIALFFHLDHGIQSALRSLGVSHPRYVGLGRHTGRALAFLITAGFVSVPLGVYLGVIK